MFESQGKGKQVESIAVMTAEVFSLFGTPPVRPAARTKYVQLMSSALRRINKDDPFEKQQIRSWVLATIELDDIAMAKNQIVNSARKAALDQLLKSTVDGDDATAKCEAFLREWYDGAREDLCAHMNKYDLTEDTIWSQAMLLRLPEYQALTALEDDLERRRENIWRALERYRAASKHPSRSTNEVITLQPEDIASMDA